MDVEERTLYEHPQNVVYACEACGKAYAAPHHLAGHERSCASNKRSIDSILQESKAFWESRKKRRLEKQSMQPEMVPEALVGDDTGVSEQSQGYSSHDEY